LFTNNWQIGLQTESMRVESYQGNLPVSHISANYFIFFKKGLLINARSCNSLNLKIWKEKIMYTQNGKPYYWYGVIYKITNLANRKVYIGQTIETNYIKYIKNHFNRAKKHYREENKHLYNSIRKYGKENFVWEILGYCYSQEELNLAEIDSIWLFRSFGSDGENWDNIYGYNSTKGGEGVLGLFKELSPQYIKFSDKQIQKIIKEYKNGTPLLNIAKMLKVSTTPVRRVLKKFDIVLRSRNISAKNRKNHPSKIQKKDHSFVINEYISGKTAKEISKNFNIDSLTPIYMILKKAGIETRKNFNYSWESSLKGKTWEERFGKEKSEQIKQKRKKNIQGKFTKDKSPSAKKVINLTTGKIFNSIIEACEFYNISYGSITDSCKLKRKGKYIWRYLDDK